MNVLEAFRIAWSSLRAALALRLCPFTSDSWDLYYDEMEPLWLSGELVRWIRDDPFSGYLAPYCVERGEKHEPAQQGDFERDSPVHSKV